MNYLINEPGLKTIIKVRFYTFHNSGEKQFLFTLIFLTQPGFQPKICRKIVDLNGLWTLSYIVYIIYILGSMLWS
jgi:hypothetical protein